MSMAGIVVWAQGNPRIWWACPTCKLEGGITLTASAAELHERLGKFLEQHKECNDKEVSWRRSA